MEEKNKEESIDLKELIEIAVKEKKRIMAIIGVCLAMAIAVAFILPKQYESTVLVRAKAPGQGGLSAAAGAMAALGLGGNASSSTMAYIELMKSRSVLEPIIEQLDIEPEVKEKMTAEGFAKSNLTLANTKGTDLIEITAKGKSPEEAQSIATGVYDGFRGLMTRLNKNDQSQVISFLTDRMSVAKEDMDQAAKALEAFRQEEKVYVPDEQAKALLEKTMAYDKVASEAQVAKETAKTNLEAINAQLAKQNAALVEFNIADNSSIQKIRDTLIEQQIGLISLQQKYTEQHPDVIRQKEQISALNQQLAREVKHSVQAETNTLNPIHAGLLQNKVMTETAIIVGERKVEAANELREQAEEEMGKLSGASLTYVELSRKAQMTTEVYGMLVRNHEQAKIQEAMDSMDLQLVDAADLPKKPSAPNKRLIAVIGGVVGIMIAFGYVLFMYSRRPYRKESKVGV